MTAAADKTIVEDYIDALEQGDLERVGALIADDIVVHIPGNNPISGDKRGREAVLAHYRPLLERGPVSVDMHDLLASDDHVVALSSRTFAGVEARAVAVYHVHDGRIQELWVHEADQEHVDRTLKETWNTG